MHILLDGEAVRILSVVYGLRGAPPIGGDVLSCKGRDAGSFQTHRPLAEPFYLVGAGFPGFMPISSLPKRV